MLKVKMRTMQPMGSYGNHIKQKKELKVAVGAGGRMPNPDGDGDGDEFTKTPLSKEALEHIKNLYNNYSTDKFYKNPTINTKKK